MTFNELRVKWAGLFEAMRLEEVRVVAIRVVVRDALAHLGAPTADALAAPMAIGRHWFSLWDVQRAPFYRLQRFEA